MKLLVTGGLGFVGINLVRCLAEKLDCPVAAADVAALNPTRRAFLQPVMERVRFHRLDVRDRDALRAVVGSEQITHIIHAAAITPSFEQEQAQAPWVVDVNLIGAINALTVGFETARVEQVLVCSSSGVYGAPAPGNRDLQSEDGPLDVSHLYAITKISAETIAARFAQLGPTRMTSLRLGSVYGAMEAPSDSRQRVSQVQRLADGLRTGRALRLAGPEVRRDWVYAVDVAEAVRLLLLAPLWNYPVYNVGSGQATAFKEVVAPFARRGLQLEWVADPGQADIAMTSESARAALDISRLEADTGFLPKFSFEAGVADYLDRD